MKAEELAQWVIDNRYPKNENEKVSDSEMYNYIVNTLKNWDISNNTVKKVCDCLIPSPDFNRTMCFKCNAPLPKNI